MEPIEISLGKSKVVFREKSSNLKHDSASYSKEVEPKIVATLEEAQQVARFEIWQPTLLPFSGITLEKVILLFPMEGTYVISKYSNSLGNWMIIRQQPLVTNLQIIPIPFPIRETKVAGRSAALFDSRVTATNQPTGQLTLTHCLWEYKDFLMEFEAPFLSEDVIIQIAESLV